MLNFTMTVQKQTLSQTTPEIIYYAPINDN